MQLVKYKKYANYMKLAIVVIIMSCSGILYSCSFHATNENIQYATLESEGQYVTMEAEETGKMQEKTNEADTAKLCVYVCGCVLNPGVYEVQENARIYQAIDMAGGMTENADYNYLNMAEFLIDGQKIYVPDINENLSIQMNQQTVVGTSNTLVNINNATKEQLMTLPGIGESRADDILAFRNTNGKFETIDDIKKVSGIKDAAFNKIKDLIVVK